jgi:hypothetical protein
MMNLYQMIFIVMMDKVINYNNNNKMKMIKIKIVKFMNHKIKCI